MRLPFLWPFLGFAAGILLESRCRLANSWLIFFFVLGLLFLWQRRGRRVFPYLFLILTALLGIFYARQDMKPEPRLPDAVFQSPFIRLEGRVLPWPQSRERKHIKSLSFTMDVSRLTHWSGAETSTIQVQTKVRVYLLSPPFVPAAGDVVAVDGRFGRIPQALNPGEFPRRKFWKKQQVFFRLDGHGYAALSRSGERRASPFTGWIRGLRLHIKALIHRRFSPENAALLETLILGNRYAIPASLKDAFLKTGTVHLLAISGLHISLLAGTVYLICLKFKFRQPAAAGLALTAVLLYAFIAGFGIPVRRAAWMMVMAFLACLLNREKQALNALFCIAFLLLVNKPSDLFSISFQLSFLSVFFLLVFYPDFIYAWPWQRVLCQTAVAVAAVFPLVLYYFHVFTPVVFAANVLLIPVFHLALLYGFLSLLFNSVPFAGDVFSSFTDLFLETGLWMVRFLSEWKAGHFFLEAPARSEIFFYYGTLLLWTALRREWVRLPWKRSKAIVFTLLLGCVFALITPGQEKAFALTLLSAGKNEIAHVRFRGGHHWLIHTGRGRPSSQTRRVLLPYLRSAGINGFSGIVLADSFRRHWGGLQMLLQEYPVHYVFYPKAKRSTLRREFENLNSSTDWVALETVGSIRMSKGGSVQILGCAEERCVVSLSVQGWDFMFLPPPAKGVLRILKAHKESLKDVEVIVLPSTRGGQSELLDSLWAAFKPALVVIPGAGEVWTDKLNKLGIQTVGLEALGAVRLRVVDERLCLTSFLEETPLWFSRS